MLKAVVLDFDGVVVESNQVKDAAFKQIFSRYPEHFEHMMTYHYSHNAVDRREKFRYFVEEILGLPGRSDIVESFCSRFSNETTRKIIECPFVQGAVEFLECVAQKYSLYVVSATPREPLVEIINARGLSRYFKDVFGAPQGKVSAIQEVMVREGANKDEILFIGDTKEDERTASSIGVGFVARKSDREMKTARYPVFPDMAAVHRFFAEYYE